MAWYHVADETTSAPAHQLVPWRDRNGRNREAIGKVPTGKVVVTTHSIWRCYQCKAMAVTALNVKPAFECGKCGAHP